MTRWIRIVGFLLIAAGAAVLASYLFEPLRQIWPLLLSLPLPIRIGLGIAGVGLLMVLGTVLHERFEALEADKTLLED